MLGGEATPGGVRRGELQFSNFREGGTNDTLKIAIHSRGVDDGSMDLLLAFGPYPFHSPFFSLQIFFEREKGFNDSLDALFEFGSREIPIDQLHFIVLPDEGAPGISQLNEIGPKRGCDPDDAGKIDYEDAVDAAQSFDLLGEGGGDQNSEIGLGFPLIVFEFLDPVLAPRLCLF